MSRVYKTLPSLEVLKDFLELTDAYPSGLVWKKENRWHKSGEMAGRWTGKYYLVRMLADQYHAHRIVYYMRTGIEPGDGDVVHLRNNPSKDNRKELIFYDGKTKLSNVKNPAYIKTRFKISLS